MARRVTHSIENEEQQPDANERSRASDGGWTFVAQAHYDPSELRELTTVIVGAIAESEGISITAVRSPPLYEVVDVAAMEQALFGRTNVSPNGAESAVEFRYNEYKVSVEEDGWVTVSRRADGTTAD
jgi:hypothetical protein